MFFFFFFFFLRCCFCSIFLDHINCLSTVTEFAKKTGDYGSLSAVDIRVMALTLQLEKENVGVDHIKTAPEKKVGKMSLHKILQTRMCGHLVGLDG